MNHALRLRPDSGEAHFNYGYLSKAPLWPPLRSGPRFEALVASLAPK